MTELLDISVSAERLLIMQEDLLEFINQGILDKKIKIKSTDITKPNKKKYSRKTYNTLIESKLPLDQSCKMRINLDATYSRTDVYKLAQKYVLFADHQIKKDAYHLGILSLFLKEKHPKMLPGNVFQLAVREFLKLKDAGNE